MPAYKRPRWDIHRTQLYAEIRNRQRRSPVPCVGGIRAEQHQDRATLRVYGPIGEFQDGVTAAVFAQAVDKFPRASHIDVRINSGGGTSDEAVAMFNTLQRHGAKITTHNDGLVSRAAVLLYLAGHERLAGEGTLFSLGPSQAIVAGESGDMREAAAVLEKLDQRQIDLLATKTGQTRAAVEKLVKASAWLNRAEARDIGLAASFDAAAASNRTQRVAAMVNPFTGNRTSGRFELS